MAKNEKGGSVGNRGIEAEISIGSRPYLNRNLIISRQSEGILSRVQKVTLQHWKIYRKIAGGREVQTNSAEKLIERDRGDPVLPREASTGRLSRARIFYFGRHSMCFDFDLHVRVVRKYFPSLIR